MKKSLKTLFGAVLVGTFAGAAVLTARKLALLNRRAQNEAENTALLDEEPAPEMERSYTTIPSAHTEEEAAE
ncbi:MAG: hypothetical protein IJR36_08420 [Lachnospiraceae bacterium]|nr:hypothetical protein [Lachnospiraceae bacterium]MBQ9562837.1 hypothetical protein [Lachnospiraceae bacterium]MBQ9593882.1 hypothetical protein [Lachnospiraceae bacterium]MBR0152423.1 hypothetical protein [Lachnospiraceae bacterium]